LQRLAEKLWKSRAIDETRQWSRKYQVVKTAWIYFSRRFKIDPRLGEDCVNLAPGNNSLEVRIMEWTSPQFEEIALNCEINSYASAAM
jgi:hypothetical protein